MQKLQFKAGPRMNNYRGHDHEAGAVIFAQDGDIIEASDSHAEYLLKNFPDNFSRASRKAKEEINPEVEVPKVESAGLDAAEDKEIKLKSRRIKRK